MREANHTMSRTAGSTFGSTVRAGVIAALSAVGYIERSEGRSMDSVLEFIGKLILAIVLLFVLLPIIWVVTSPFIFLASAFVSGPYRDNVNRGFQAVSKVWLGWGILLLP